MKWPKIFKTDLEKWKHTYQEYHQYCGNTEAHHNLGYFLLYTDDQDGCQRTAGHAKLENQAEMGNN